MNKIDLKQQLRAAGYKKKELRLPVMRPPAANVQELNRIYMTIVYYWTEQARNRVMPEYRQTLSVLRMDSVFGIDAIISAIANGAVNVIAAASEAFRGFADRNTMKHFKKIAESLKYETNVDLTTQIQASGQPETIDDFMLRNTALIRNISDEARGRISDIVFRAVQSRTSSRKVAKEISDALGISRARALRIASDQSNKLSAALDTERFKQLGAQGFEWVHSGKKHYRLHHLQRDGKYFKWSDPEIINDMPADAPFCGCHKRMVLKL